MSFRDWLHGLTAGRVIPLIGLLAIVGGYGLASCDLSSAIGSQDKSPYAESNQSDANLWAPIPFDHRPIAKSYTARCDQPKDREEADLCQQWRAANAAESAVKIARSQIFWNWVQAATVIVSAFAAWAAAKAAKSANDSVSVAREIARDQSRAYVQAKKAKAEWEGGILPIITITVENRGQTPARWFGYRCVVASSELPSRPFDREAVQKAKRTCWYGLGPNDKRTFQIAQDILLPFANQSGPRKSFLRVDGQIEYETFFGELYVSEFSFNGNVDPQNGLEHILGEVPRMKSIKISHGTHVLRSYFYIGQATKNENEPA